MLLTSLADQAGPALKQLAADLRTESKADKRRGGAEAVRRRFDIALSFQVGQGPEAL